MNVVILQGRLTDDPKVWYGNEGNSVSVARYTLAVDRYHKKEGEDTADFIHCVTFIKGAAFAAKYLKKGMKITIRGSIQTGNYTNRDGVKVGTTEVVVSERVCSRFTGEESAEEGFDRLCGGSCHGSVSWFRY